MPRPKGAPRKQACFTIDEAVLDRLKQYSKKTLAPKARVVQEAIIEFLDKREVDNEEIHQIK